MAWGQWILRLRSRVSPASCIEQTIQWNCLHPGIQAATLVGRPSGVSTFCTFCREPDHASDRCALAYLHPPSGSQPRQQQNASTPMRPTTRSRPLPPDICISWNKGACRYPANCRYRHICATCFARHNYGQGLHKDSCRLRVQERTEPASNYSPSGLQAASSTSAVGLIPYQMSTVQYSQSDCL